MTNPQQQNYFVYMTASRPRGVIYTGMTSDLAGRAWQHRERVVAGFTKRYWAGRLVYDEHHLSSAAATQREYLMKRWLRDWKIDLIEKDNSTWRDLYEELWDRRANRATMRGDRINCCTPFVLALCCADQWWRGRRVAGVQNE